MGTGSLPSSLLHPAFAEGLLLAAKLEELGPGNHGEPTQGIRFYPTEKFVDLEAPGATLLF